MSLPDWMGDALCAQTDPETFFPEKGQSGRPAKEICARCPVASQCLDYALTTGASGVWGGTSEKDRRGMGGASAHRRALAAERTRFAQVAVSRGVDVADLADHLGVDEVTVRRYLEAGAA